MPCHLPITSSIQPSSSSSCSRSRSAPSPPAPSSVPSSSSPIAVASYLNGVPTAGNDLVLVGILALIGALIGIASGQTVKMRRGADGEVLAQARWGSAFFWVLGMGSRFAFLIWINASGGKADLATFSQAHHITSGEAWTVALLAMAVFEVVGRSLVMALRRHQLQFAAPAAPARLSAIPTVCPDDSSPASIAGRPPWSGWRSSFSPRWSVLRSHPGPGGSGRELVISGLLIAIVVAYLVWTAWPLRSDAITPELYVLAIAGGVLTAAAPQGAGSAFAFVAIVTAGVRVDIARAVPLVLLATLALACSVLIYDRPAIGLLAYALGFAAALLAASNARQSRARADQAELLLAQAQRTQEEQVRTARLEESSRIAREIHDVLAHALAGLTIQLEATRALIEQGADRDAVLERVGRAHALAREGLQETRRAVGALRGDQVAVADAVRALVEEYRAGGQGEITLTIDGDVDRLTGATGLAVVRTVQEGLTNVRKHAPGATVAVAVDAEPATEACW